MPRLCRRSVGLVLALLCLAGCPRNTQTPERPGRAQTCSSLADCQPDGGATCGALRNCVDRRCEEAPSLFIPCE
ncbi:MAG: hypothetical protein GXP55_24245 [Deltaproteobacteria bacterium]|nr:hypothetical protein [Deltaproteobacteria bacterium]